MSILAETNLQEKITQQLNEGYVGPELLMILDEVIRAGKFTNPVQQIICARLVESLQYNGDFTTIADYSKRSTPKSVIDTIRELTNEEAFTLAATFKNLLEFRDQFIEFTDKARVVDGTSSMSPKEWLDTFILLPLKKQD
jgi:hypothetical protein